MTAVRGHLTAAEFPPDFKNWEHPPPEALFDARIITTIPDVSTPIPVET
jgi:DNA topoisomerase-3